MIHFHIMHIDILQVGLVAIIAVVRVVFIASKSEDADVKKRIMWVYTFYQDKSCRPSVGLLSRS
jgi:hypothetical protein